MPTSGDHLPLLPPWLLPPALAGALWVIEQPGGKEWLFETVVGFYLTPVIGDVWLDTYVPTWQPAPSPIT